VVNQYGSVFGYLETGAMTLPQSQVEKASLEILLTQNPKDSVILTALRSEDDSDFQFVYNDYSTGGSRFDAKGKLRLDAGVENPGRRLPRLISESQNRELFERYGRLRLRIAWLTAHPPAPEPAGNPSDTLWSGAYRVNGGALNNGPADFPDLAACRAWGVRAADSLRARAFAYVFQCRSSKDTISTQLW
jgi:hypothetical protein